MWNPFRPPPVPPAFGQGKVIPESYNPISRILFTWLSPIMAVGFSRPLEEDDLWSLPDFRLTRNLTSHLEERFYKRCPPEERPSFLFENGDDLVQNLETTEKGGPESIERFASSTPTAASEKQDPLPPRSRIGRQTNYDGSLIKAAHGIIWKEFWFSGLMKLFADTLNTTTPLVNQVLLNWLTASYVFYHANEEERSQLGLQQPRGLGYGIGIAFAIFAMQEVSSLMMNQYEYLSMLSGLTFRSCLTGAIFRKSLRLSNRARVEHSVGKITTLIAADSVRLDRAMNQVHNLWVAPIQDSLAHIAIGIGLLIHNLGVSALVGLGVIIVGFPIQMLLALAMFGQRKKGVAFTDQRVRLVTEILSGIRLIKYYAWETFYIQKVNTVRVKEIATIRKKSIAQAVLIGFVISVPVLGSVLSIVTYALLGHPLNVGIIFTSVQLFNIIRAPLILFPVVIATATDALVALKRIGSFLRAEELAVPYTIKPSSEVALDVEGDFTWEVVRKDESTDEKDKDKDKSKKDKKAKKVKEDAEPTLPITATPDEKKEQDEKPYELKDLKIRVPKGAFVAIVGRVGSGKSSVLQALIGEMKKTRGDCVFSSAAAYVPQTAWIMNATVRQNIIFGQPEDEAKFRRIVKACCLEPDLKMLPHGEATEIGEKGINLSGGQRARVSLARAAYSDAEIVLMDDSLSAVDSHVGKKLLDNCLLNGPLANKTRILVTHALHVLDRTDYIYVLDEGKIVEQGTYTALRENGQMFSRLMEEYGSAEQELAVTGTTAGEEVAKVQQAKRKDSKAVAPSDPDADPGLMQVEERVRGAVTWDVYSKYFKSAGGSYILPLIVFWILLAQGTTVLNSLFLGFWTSDKYSNLSQGEYMAIYAATGVAVGVFTSIMNFLIYYAGLTAGLHIFVSAFTAVIRSPVSFFDTTPLGRILSRLSKDQDTIDSELPMITSQFVFIASSILGTVVLVFYTFPYLGIIFIPLIALYLLAAKYYRRSSVEVKRIDSLLRSILYGSYSEALTGLSTIRAYRSQQRFVVKSEEGLDLENRAYYMTIAIQQWLICRLDILGNTLVLGICLFAAGFRKTVNPSDIGVVLSYTLGITQTFSEIVSSYAQNEQNFNAVERLLHYTELSGEGAVTTPNDPEPSWPSGGAITFKNVKMAYRSGLPPVLKGVDFEVKSAEKIGIFGRTGAGKSSLLQALFRIVNIQEGKIVIDGVNIANIGLETLRGRLALVPQDSVLFQGTLRDNLDPLKMRTDAEIIDALKRTWLLPRECPADSVAQAKFSLDSPVADEGSNYSAGEKQLLALCRALVKNSRIIVLDEATSSVDVETDAKVQRTIQAEFSSSTLLCIAHRLNTIVYYDRILVMDAGKVAEFDTPLSLFDKEDSIFRSLCNEASLSRADIVKIRASAQGQSSVPASSNASIA